MESAEELETAFSARLDEERRLREADRLARQETGAMFGAPKGRNERGSTEGPESFWNGIVRDLHV